MTVPVPMRACALTQGATIPSTRFRVEQHLEALRTLGVEVTHLPARHGAYPPAGLAARAGWLPRSVLDGIGRVRRANEFEVTWLQRELVSTLHTAERLLRRPMVFDVDDAIFLHPRGRRTDAIARRARTIICGNAFLAEHYARLGPVEIIPTAIDADRFRPAPPAERGRPTIVWSGSSSGFPYLESIAPALASVLRARPDARFLVMAERTPLLPGLPPDQVEFRRWRPEAEVAALQEATVGIMPLYDTDWARGKCSFKMLTYMACALPVVVSPVGMNVEVLRLAECGAAATTDRSWSDALLHFLGDESLARRAGQQGRRVVEAHFSVKALAPRIAEVLRRAAGR